MRLNISVIPNSRKSEVIKLSDSSFKVKVDAPPVEGKANSRLITILSDYFNVPKSSITIVKGSLSKRKVIEIDDNILNK